MEEARRCLVFDPRVGLALLVFANLAAFSEQPFWMEMIPRVTRWNAMEMSSSL